MPAMPGLADELGPLIQAIGISEVARRADVDRTTLYRFINGEMNLNEKKLHAIADAVGRRIVVRKPEAYPLKKSSDALADPSDSRYARPCSKTAGSSSRSKGVSRGRTRT